jgi:hypothetical protein
MERSSPTKRILRDGVVLIYCVGYRYSHPLAISGDRWPGNLKRSDIESRFVCGACGKRGADESGGMTDTEDQLRLMGNDCLLGDKNSSVARVAEREIIPLTQATQYLRVGETASYPNSP